MSSPSGRRSHTPAAIQHATCGPELKRKQLHTQGQHVQVQVLSLAWGGCLCVPAGHQGLPAPTHPPTPPSPQEASLRLLSTQRTGSMVLARRFQATRL
jgi:hypothetical protein